MRQASFPGYRFHLPRPLTGAVMVVFVVVAGFGTILGCRDLLEPLKAHEAPRNWVANVRHDAETNAPALIVDGRPPEDVYGFGFWPEEAWLSKMLAASPSTKFSGSAQSLFAVQEDGHLQQSEVTEMAAAEPGPVPDCGYPLGAGEQRDLVLTESLYAWNWALEAVFIAGQPGDLVVTVDGVDISVSVPEGVSTIYAPVNSTVSQVHVSATQSSGTVCLLGLKFGPPTAKAAN